MAGTADRLRAEQPPVAGEIELADETGLQWVDELVLGRSGEDPAAIRFSSETRILCNGAPLLDDGLALEPAAAEVWRGPAVLGDARYIGSQLLAGSADREATGEANGEAGNLPTGWTTLAGGGRLARVLDADPLVGRKRLALLR